MSVHFIRVQGCDDSTKIRMELSDADADLVARVFAAITSHGGGCRPVASICSTPDDIPVEWGEEAVAEEMAEYTEAVITGD